MSYLSMSESVGFGGLAQNISDASCATQYKLAVEGMPGVCTSDGNVYLNDSSGDENYTHINENFLHSKFKIDPNELYTFNDSDVVAGEITVDHTEDNNIFTDTPYEKNKLIFDIPKEDVDLLQSITNGYIKHDIRNESLSNGHVVTETHLATIKETNSKAKVQKNVIVHDQPKKDILQIDISKETHKEPKTTSLSLSNLNQTSITSVNVDSKATTVSTKSASETFLDVFKREQGVSEGTTQIKTETVDSGPAKPTVVKVATKKAAPVKTASSTKSKRGRGPAVHEALQRIQERAITVQNKIWHAPGDELFDCGPLEHIKSQFHRHLDTSSSEDDDQWPNFGDLMGCVEEGEVHRRGARLALRRAALRRQVAHASTALKLTSDHRRQRLLATLVKRQLSATNTCGRLPANTLAHLLAVREMRTVLTSQERRQLRESGWSCGGVESNNMECAIGACAQVALPSAAVCGEHVMRAPNQRLFAPCAAVFAAGDRCARPLLPLHAHTPLCPDHAWKRDNYDKLVRDNKPKKMVRKRPWAPAPKKGKRKRRPPSARESEHRRSVHSLSELNVCSNSSTYDSSEDPTMGGLSENEFITTTGSSHELVEVEQVPPDDILDPAVLSQIPDEAFTEFFNQAEGGAAFAESSELARALEAVLDERALDTLAECAVPTKMEVHSTIDVETTSTTPS